MQYDGIQYQDNVDVGFTLKLVQKAALKEEDEEESSSEYYDDSEVKLLLIILVLSKNFSLLPQNNFKI